MHVEAVEKAVDKVLEIPFDVSDIEFMRNRMRIMKCNQVPFADPTIGFVSTPAWDQSVGVHSLC